MCIRDSCFQAEDGIRDPEMSRGLGDVYKRQDHPHEMALQEIMKLTNETYGKDWRSQTVSTYIAKLVKKGFLKMNQSGRNATYEILIPELAYQQEQSHKFVKFWNRGSVAQFLTAFYKDHKLTKEEIEELRKSIDELDQ